MGLGNTGYVCSQRSYNPTIQGDELMIPTALTVSANVAPIKVKVSEARWRSIAYSGAQASVFRKETDRNQEKAIFKPDIFGPSKSLPDYSCHDEEDEGWQRSRSCSCGASGAPCRGVGGVDALLMGEESSSKTWVLNPRVVVEKSEPQGAQRQETSRGACGGSPRFSALSVFSVVLLLINLLRRCVTCDDGSSRVIR